jgi:O-antigen ligase
MSLDWFGTRVSTRRVLLVLIVPSIVLFAAAALLLPPGLVRMAVLLLLAIPFCLFCLDRPTLIFYALIIILFSNLDVFTPFRLYRFALLLFFAAFAVAIAKGRRLVVHHLVLIALAAAFLILTFQSLSIARNVDAGLSRLDYIIKSLVGVAVAGQFVRDRREFHRFLAVVALAILLSSLVPLVIKPPSQFASLSMVWSQGFFRYEGFAFEPNTFAVFQIFLIPILMALMVVYRRPPVLRLVVSGAILASIVVLVLSFSRGGFIGLVVLLVLLVILERKNRSLLGLGLVVIAAGIALAPTVYWDRVKSILFFNETGQPDYAIYTRLETMKTALKLGIAHPFLGVGLDNFLYYSSRYLPFKMVVHNTFLQIFAELGVGGLAIFIGIIGCNIAIMKRMSERRDDPEAAEVGRLLLIQHVAVIANSLFIPIAYETLFLYMLALPAFADYAYRRLPARPSATAAPPYA